MAQIVSPIKSTSFAYAERSTFENARRYDNGLVPDSDPTLELLGVGIAAIWLAAACPVIAKPLVAR